MHVLTVYNHLCSPRKGSHGLNSALSLPCVINSFLSIVNCSLNLEMWTDSVSIRGGGTNFISGFMVFCQVTCNISYPLVFHLGMAAALAKVGQGQGVVGTVKAIGIPPVGGSEQTKSFHSTHDLSQGAYSAAARTTTDPFCTHYL